MNKVLTYIFLSFILISNTIAEDKLDLLDKQSKEFFKAITGLEKDYLEKQIVDIKKKADSKVKRVSPGTNTNQKQVIISSEQLPISNQVSQEEYAKNVFRYENEMARLTTDFTRTKKLKDIKIKSMYSFNSNKYVVLEALEDNEESVSAKEASFKIEGRYKKGDYILTHRIVDINTQTKTVKLYKKLDEEFGYYIVLSNYGISVSDLRKIEKKKEKIEKKKNDVTSFSKSSTLNSKKNISECIFKVNVDNLNVRNDSAYDAKILRILRNNDEFTIQSRNGNWLRLDTIYKNVSGDVMFVGDDSNWVSFSNSLIKANPNCL